VANVGDSRCILIHNKDEAAGAPNISAANEKESLETPELPDESAIPSGVEEDNMVESQNGSARKATTVVRALSEDHKPDLPSERARIEKAGFQVVSIEFEEDGKMIKIHKVAKSETDKLALSRAFGDFDYKCNTELAENEQAVIPIADVQVHKRDPRNDLLLVLACDGVYDVMNNQEVMDYVHHQVEIKSKALSETLLPDIADALLMECLKRGSRDNMSAILVSLQPSLTSASSPTNMAPKMLDFESPKK